jgi:cobalt/nickel transport system permease protein
VINTLAQIDFVASAGRSPWHKASALGKLMLAGLAVLLAVFAPGLGLGLALYGLGWLLVLTSRLPLRLLLLAASYPLLFAVLFAALRWDGDPWAALLRLLRPLTASLFAAWLVGTTPYPDLFAPLSRVLPRAAGDALFLTYRALFELLARAQRMFRALHLRAAAELPAHRRLPVAGEGLGTLVLHGFERSERMYSVMLLRGHSGRICGCRHWAEWSRSDLWVVAAAVVLCAAALLLWRMP